MADEHTGVSGQSDAGGAAKVALSPEEEWKRAVAQRRGYTARNTKAMAAGILVALVISGIFIGGFFMLVEGDWDGSRPQSMARLFGLLSTPGVLVGIWVRNKLKVPNS